MTTDRLDLPTGDHRRRAGAGTYTRPVLATYDPFVLGVVCRVVWRCPRREMQALYDRNTGGRHLDLGPGTGYFLDHCRFPVLAPRLTLIDLNDGVLEHAARRLARYAPATRRQDVCEPLGPERHDSVALNFLLHCLPGPMERKATVFDRVADVLAPGGVVFGSTVLCGGVSHSPPARRMLHKFNKQGTFDNEGDTLAGLITELSRRFTDPQVVVRGSVALFEARR